MTVHVVGCDCCGDIEGCSCKGIITPCKKCDMKDVCNMNDDDIQISKKCAKCATGGAEW